MKLALSNVEHAQGEVETLRGVSLEVAIGEVVGVVGPNGAGKTTLLEIALGILAPDRGRVTLGGDDVATLPRKEIARRAAYVPQSMPFDEALTVRDLVAMGRYAREGDSEAAITRALEATGLARLSERSLGAISGGERQRTALARAFAQESPLLVLDEPSASLDITQASKLHALVRAHVRDREGSALIAIHDLNAAARWCDRIAVMRAGEVLEEGPPRRVLTAAIVAEAFGGEVRVIEHEGELLVVPL